MSFLKHSLIKEKITTNFVFGKDLQELLIIQQQEIPIVVQQTIEWLEEYGLDEEGLFRISGNQLNVEKIKNEYDKNPTSKIDLHKFIDDKISFIHTIATLLKLYFRELPQPLLLYRYYSTFIKVQKNPNQEVRLKNFHILIQRLPKGYKELCVYLFKFLNKVVQHSSKNMMTSRNLATCWAPNLLRAEVESYEQIMTDSENVKNIIMTLIDNIEIFSKEKMPLYQKAFSFEENSQTEFNSFISSNQDIKNDQNKNNLEILKQEEILQKEEEELLEQEKLILQEEETLLTQEKLIIEEETLLIKEKQIIQDELSKNEEKQINKELEKI